MITIIRQDLNRFKLTIECWCANRNIKSCLKYFMSTGCFDREVKSFLVL